MSLRNDLFEEVKKEPLAPAGVLEMRARREAGFDLFGNELPPPPPPRKRGRPFPGQEVYRPEIVEEICTRLMHGETLIDICKDTHMPHKDVVLKWIRDKPDFYDKYLQARRVQMETYVDEIIKISDDKSEDLITTLNNKGETVQMVNKAKILRDRLRVDTRKWLAAHLAPNLYSDKTKIELSGSIGAYDISKLGDEELAQLERILTRVAVAVGGPVIEGLALPGPDSERDPEA